MTDLPFGFDTPKESPGFLLWQTTISWQRLIKKSLEPHGISHAQFVIIAILLWLQGQEKDATQTDIINMSKLDKMTVSKSLKKLAHTGLVIRHENKEDTRSKLVFLTPSGKHLTQKLVPIIEGIDAEFFGQLKTKQADDLITILQEINNHT